MKSSSSQTLQNLTQIGSVLTVRGLKGEIVVKLSSADMIAPGDFLLIGPLGNQKKYTVLTIKSDSKIVLQLKEVHDRTTAEGLVKAPLFIESEKLVSKTGEKIFLKEVLNFKVVDSGAEVGTIVGFDSNNSQDLLIVKLSDDREALIPFVKAFLEKIDFENRLVLMRLPEGLLSS